MKLLPVVLLLLLNTAVQSDLLKDCYLQKFTLGDSEGKLFSISFPRIEKILTHFEKLIKDKKTIKYECLELLIQRGLYKTALEVYENYFILNHIDVKQQIQAFLKTQTNIQNVREIQTLFKHAMSQTNKVQSFQPVVQWAQSKNNTLINIKFSHRQDAPACLNAKVEILEITSNSIHVEAFGIISHIPMKYKYQIQLFKPIDPQLSINKTEAVGTMFLNLTKVTPNDLWIRLTVEDYKTPIWWDLRDNLGKDMEDFVALLEKESERKEKKADKVYKKSQLKRQKEKERQDRLNEIEKQRQWEYEHNENFPRAQRCENGWFQRQ